MGLSAAIIGSSVVGAGASIIGSSNAANAQTNAANQASKVQQQQYAQTRADLLPYNTAGQGATAAENYLLGIGPNNGQNVGGYGYGALTSPIKMDEATLQQTPGYQFNLSQGLKAVQNSAAARGLGTSGAALKGAAGYATGLADSTYQNQFNNAVTNQTNAFNRLNTLSGLGENAAAQTGNYGTQTAENIGNNLIGAGNAQGAASIAAANGISGAASSIPQGLLLNNLINTQGGGLYGGFGAPGQTTGVDPNSYYYGGSY